MNDIWFSFWIGLADIIVGPFCLFLNGGYWKIFAIFLIIVGILNMNIFFTDLSIDYHERENHNKTTREVKQHGISRN